MTTILTKKKDTAGAPVAGDLTNAAGGAELAVNTATKRLYTKDSGGNVVEIGTNPSTIDTTTVDTTNLEVTNIKAKDGTASASIADTTGIFTHSKATIVEVTDNTNAALRITQLGTGNALLVEDSTNPDSTPVAIDTSGNLLVGITTAQTINTLTPAFQQLGAGNYGSIWSGRYSANATGNGIYLSKSRSATVGTNTIVQSGDDLGTLFFFGADGTDLIQAASILAEVDGTPGTGDMPGRLVFSTTADGASTPTERMRIDSIGNVGIGASTANYQKLGIGGTYPVSSNISEVVSARGDFPAASSGTDTFLSRPTTSGAIPTLRHFRANPGTFTGAVTSQYGFVADSTMSAATNNYGFYGNLASAANTYNLYMNGTADNYLTGALGVGTTSLTGYSLRVSKNMTGSTAPVGIASTGTIQSDATSNAQYFRSGAATQATAFTLPSLYHYLAAQGTFGVGSTVTNQYGFYVDNGLTGATNNYGFYSNIGSGTNRYNFYAGGTADNYFAGNVGVGTTTPTSLLQTTGSSSESAFKTPNIAEVNTISATAATGTINYDVTTQSVLYYTTNASGNFTVNFRGSSGTSLNTVMQTGESISATFLVTNGATAYYNSAVQVDGSSVTPKWQGGTAPTSGNASSIDSYTYVIIKTGSAAFTVLASVTKFA